MVEELRWWEHRSIIASGVLLGSNRDSVYIHIPEISSSPLKFNVELQEDISTYTEYEDKDADNMFVKVFVSSDRGALYRNSTGVVGKIEILNTEKKIYYFNYVLNFIGDREDFVYSLLYNVAKMQQ